MKRFLPILVLLAMAGALIARDEGGDGDIIPDYQELVREGYGPHHDYSFRGYYPMVNTTEVMVPMPTQAYYGRGYTIYYGFTPLRAHPWETSMIYAFGYSADFYRRIMPESLTNVNLDRYSVSVIDQKVYKQHGEPITTVQPTASTVPVGTSNTQVAR
jgi:hypothetical protein